jgi:type II secretory pathway pseudopilin PulG
MGRASGRRRGLVLLEVVLAVALFVLSAVMVGASVRASLSASQRMSQRTRALALAQTLLAKIRSDCPDITATDNAQGDFAPQFPNYRYKLAVNDDQNVASLRHITVTITWDVWPGVSGSEEIDTVSLAGWEYRPKAAEAGADASASGATGGTSGGGTAGP